jgi:hypothetical protein
MAALKSWPTRERLKSECFRPSRSFGLQSVRHVLRQLTAESVRYMRQQVTGKRVHPRSP